MKKLETPGPTQPRSIFYFMHSGGLAKLLTRLGLFRDEIPLTAQDYYKFGRRRWQTSRFLPMASNLIFAHYRCGDTLETFTYMNGEEIDVSFFRQNGGFVGAMRSLADSCNFEEMCAVPSPAPDQAPVPAAPDGPALSNAQRSEDDAAGVMQQAHDKSHAVSERGGGAVSSMGGVRSSLSMLPLPVGGVSSSLGGVGAFASKSSLEQPEIVQQGQLRPPPKLNRIVIHEEAPLPQQQDPILINDLVRRGEPANVHGRRIPFRQRAAASGTATSGGLLLNHKRDVNEDSGDNSTTTTEEPATTTSLPEEPTTEEEQQSEAS